MFCVWGPGGGGGIWDPSLWGLGFGVDWLGLGAWRFELGVRLFVSAVAPISHPPAFQVGF